MAAATYGFAALPLQTVLSFGIGSVGYVLWSIAMLQGHVFHKWTAIMGIVMGVLGIVGAAAPVVTGSAVLGLCQYLCIPLMGLWFIIVGVLLRRYGRKQALATGQSWRAWSGDDMEPESPVVWWPRHRS